MKKLLISLGIVLLFTGAAMAQQSYTGSVLSGDATLQVFHRIWHPAVDSVSPGGDTNCTAGNQFVGFDAATRSCESKFFTPKTGATGYRGYIEDIGNDGKPAGDVRYIAWDAQTGGGSASHTGYYFFAGKAVNIGETSTWNGANCAGTAAATCLAQGNDSNAAGSSVGNTPLGTVANINGFRPIPVPTVQSVNKATGDMVLTWQAASDANGTGQLSYDVFGVAKTSCTAPADTEFTGGIRNVVGTTTTVNTSAFGKGPNDPACYYFALKLHYPNAGVSVVTSRYVSANSQGVVFGGLAATVTNIEAKLMGRSGVAVTWKTSLEDGVKGFYVTRSFTATGTFERVSGLIAAKGQPSTYSYIDSAIPTLPAKGDGIYYKIETSDIDNNIASYGPVKADLGSAKGQVNQPRQQNHR